MLHRVLLKGFVSRTCVKGYSISKVTTCHWVVCRVLLQGFVSRVTAYQGLQHVTGWCVGCLWKGLCQGLQHIKDYNLSVDGAAITLQKMGWIICRYIRGNIRGKSVKSIKIRGKSVSPTDTRIRILYPRIYPSRIRIQTDTDLSISLHLPIDSSITNKPLIEHNQCTIGAGGQ
jgi:hypothetical protein